MKTLHLTLENKITATIEVKPNLILVTWFNGQYITHKKFIGYTLKEIKADVLAGFYRPDRD